MTKAIALVICGLLVFTASAIALDLDLEQALARAVDTHLSVKAQNARLSAKRRSRDFAWNAFIPRIGIGGILSRTNDPPVDSMGRELNHSWNITGSFQAQLDITLALFDGIRHTVLDYESGIIEREAARRALVRDVVKSFYHLLLLQQNIAVQEKQIETALRRYQRERRRFETGAGSEFEALSAEIALENLKPVLDTYTAAYATGLLAFKQIVGLEAADELTLRGSISVAPVVVTSEAALKAALGENPVIQSLAKAVEIQRNLRVGRINQAYTPTLSLGYTVDPTFLRDPFKDPWFHDPDKDWTQRAGMLSITLSFGLDGLVPFSRTGVELANANDGIRELEANLALAVQDTQVRVATLLLQLEKTARSIRSLQMNVGLAERAFAMAERGYEAGAYDLLEVEDAENKLREARLGVFAEKYQYLSALADLDYIANMGLKSK